MIELRDYQKKAVRELKQKMIDMLNDSEDRQKLISTVCPAVISVPADGSVRVT